MTTQKGLALPIVLALIALLQLLALGQLDTTMALLRSVTGLRDRVIAYYAADAALVLCAQQFADRKLIARLWTATGEPAYWRTAAAFDANNGLAIHIAQWPGTAFSPQCLLEMSTTGTNQTAAQHYLLTAKGVGSLFQSRSQSDILATATQIWLQAVQLVQPSETQSDSASNQWFWRSVATAPQ